MKCDLLELVIVQRRWSLGLVGGYLAKVVVVEGVLNDVDVIFPVVVFRSNLDVRRLLLWLLCLGRGDPTPLPGLCLGATGRRSGPWSFTRSSVEVGRSRSGTASLVLVVLIHIIQPVEIQPAYACIRTDAPQSLSQPRNVLEILHAFRSCLRDSQQSGLMSCICIGLLLSTCVGTVHSRIGSGESGIDLVHLCVGF